MHKNDTNLAGSFFDIRVDSYDLLPLKTALTRSSCQFEFETLYILRKWHNTVVLNHFVFAYLQIKNYHSNLTFAYPLLTPRVPPMVRVPQVENRWPNILNFYKHHSYKIYVVI